MERLRVLVGEPLLVIDFRYHLVSLIAVFLAVALGIVIGTTALNEPILADIKNQVSALEKDKRSLEDRTQTLQAQLDTTDTFAEAVAPALVSGALTGAKILLVVTNEDVPQDTVDEVTALIGEAGGSVSGTISLQPEYSDPSTATSLQNYVTGSGLPPGVQLPPTDDAGQLVGSLLAQVLMIPAGGTAPDGAAISSVLAGLSALGVLNAELVSALDTAGSGTVVAGDIASAAETGLVGVIRADPTLSAAVSTVDNVNTAAGHISTVLALGREGGGTSGKYGIGEDTQPVPPVPAPTP
jgi:Copper transport outer membrane protein, MctB